MKKRAVLITEEAILKATSPALIIDKEGRIGKYLVPELSKDLLVVYASSKKPDSEGKIAYVPYRKKNLQIPNNNFSHIFLIIGEESENLLSSIVKKSRDTNAKLIIVIPSSEDLKVIKQIENLRSIIPLTLFVTGDIYGNGLGKIDYYISNAREIGQIKLLNDGLGQSYPVFIEDVVNGIISATFQSSNKPQVFLLFQKFPLTDLAIARMIINVFPSTKVQFKKQKITNKSPYNPEGIYLKEETPILERIRELEKKYIKPEREKEKTKKKSKTKKVIILCIIGIFLLPFLTTLAFSGAGVIFLKSGVDELKHGKLITAEKKFAIAKNTFLLAGETAQGVEEILKIGGFKEEGTKITSSVKSGQQLAELGSTVVTVGIKYQSVIAGKSRDALLDAQIGSQNLRQALTIIQKLKTEDNFPIQIKQLFNKNGNALAFISSLSELLPDILGVPGEKKYLLLFQNNMEIRPGGGFIGSYAVLKFKNGKIGKLEINDIYNADGKLKGHVEPPYALRRYAGIKHWYLRDSNFNVDFQQNADKAIYFLELETGERVDGVIAIDTEVLKSLLKIYGPLKISQYNQIVNYKNIIELTQGQSQDNFFPGSTQKKDFLNALKKELFQKMQNTPIQFDSLSTELKKLAEGKHVLFVLKDDAQQKILSSSKISGEIEQLKEDDMINDYLLISEANIGGTKGNKYLKKEILHSIRFPSTTEVEHELKIDYANASDSTTKFAGDYSGFLQIVLPGNAVIKSIKIDKVIPPIIPAVTDPQIYEARNFKPQEGIEVTSDNAADKNVFGFPFSVSANDKKEITVIYSIQTEEKKNKFYSFTAAKQPGVLGEKYTLRIYYPPSQKPTKLISLTNKLSWAEYKGTQDKDIKVQIYFDK